ncbi:MAG: MATE family efflux transporter [Lachnospiraceae bacterium]
MAADELFESGSVPKVYFRFALPVVMGMVTTLVYNIVDTFFIAQTGNMELVAGVSLSAPMFTMMIGLGDIFGLGGSSLVSRLFGQKRDEDGKRISSFSFYAAFVVGLVVTIFLLLFKPQVLALLGADETTVKYASEYYFYLVLGAPFVILSYTPHNLLRMEGLAGMSMAGTVLGAVVNIILDPIFIFTLGWGAAGAAIASSLGYVCVDVFYVWALVRKSKRLSIRPRYLHVSGAELKDILVIGIPASVTNIMQTLGTAILNRFLLVYGTTAVASMGIALKAKMIVTMVMVGFAFGPQPLIGYNYGAGNRERLKKILRFCYTFQCSLAFVMSIVLILFAPQLIRIFMDDSEVIQLGAPMLRWQLYGMVFMAIVMVTTCIFQSTGKAVGALLLSINRQGILFIIMIVISNRFAGYTGVIASQAVTDLLTAVLAVVLFKKMLYKELIE